MAGIYIHIPFCKQACTYCDFYFTTSGKWMNQLVDGILKEAILQKDFLKNENAPTIINTIYFGGGTPSLLPLDGLKRIVDALRINYAVQSNAEITFEVNPDDCSKENIHSWIEAGINRISMGLQSFSDKDLKLMNRSHNSQQSVSAVKRLQDAGIENISIDLIYGIPGAANHDWLKNIELAFELQVPHLSCYSLTVEEKTVLWHLVNAGAIKIDEKLATEQFKILMIEAVKGGYEQYEISNFCKPNFESKHNSAYWKGTPYLGLGPAAHSYNGKWRQFNKPNLFTYLKAIENNQLDVEREDLNEKQKYHELMMIGLRTKWGIDKCVIQSRFDLFIYHHFEEQIAQHQKQGNLIINNNTITLTQQGKLIADKVIEDFFI